MMLAFMQEYLRIDTSHPYPAYDQAYQLFARQAESDGFSVKVIELPSRLKTLRISYRGRNASLPALALSHHVDVVPADSSAWLYHPFGGVVKDNIIYGRGAQDMKGIGVSQYFALQRIKKEGIIPDRTIHMILLPHEEVGGFAGAGSFVKTLDFRQLNIGFVLDEGKASGSSHELLIKIAERRPMKITVVSHGSKARGACLNVQNSIFTLVAFLNDINAIQEEQKSKSKELDPGLLLSINATSIVSGVFPYNSATLNTIPDQAQATLDVRVPPIMKTSEAIEMIRGVLKKHPLISHEIESYAGERVFNKNYQTKFYDSIVRAVAKKNIKAVPYFGEESSDMRFYLGHGVNGFGFTPFRCQTSLHGVNESVRLCDLYDGVDIFAEIIRDFCVSKKGEE